MGVAPVTIAPSASMLITAYDWRTAMLVIGIAAWALLIPACFLVRPAPQAAGATAANTADAPATEWTAAQALRTPQFITLALAHFACCAAHSGPIFHMVSHAMICGIAPLTAVTVYSVAGFSGLGGRLLLGVLAGGSGSFVEAPQLERERDVLRGDALGCVEVGCGARESRPGPVLAQDEGLAAT